MSKKIYKVVETRPATAYWAYEVEAESEEEAARLVQSLDKILTSKDSFTEVDWDADAEFEYQEKDITTT